MKLNKWFLIFSVLLVISIAIYSFWLRGTIILFLNGEENLILDKLVSVLYPRYYTERFRFEIDFFINKCDQILIRFILVYLGTLLFVIFNSKIKQWFQIVNDSLSIKKINNFTVFYFVFLLWICKDWYFIFNDLYTIKAFYKPLLFLTFFFKEMPNSLILSSSVFLLYIFSIFAILNIFRKWSILISLFAFMFLQMVFFSFEKLDHGYVPFTFLGVIICIANFNMNDKIILSQLQKIAQVMIVACYFFAGLEKLLSSGFTWFEAENFKVFLLLHKTYFTDFIVNNNVLCTVLPIGAMFFQLLSPLALLNKKTAFVFIVLGILFHLNTWFLFGVGALVHPWIVCYIVFWRKM